jgi:hypothetical protein
MQIDHAKIRSGQRWSASLGGEPPSGLLTPRAYCRKVVMLAAMTGRGSVNRETGTVRERRIFVCRSELREQRCVRQLTGG